MSSDRVIFFLVNQESFDNTIKSVARTFAWATPQKIDNLYFDDHDHFGVLFWYNDSLEQAEKMKTK